MLFARVINILTDLGVNNNTSTVRILPNATEKAGSRFRAPNASEGSPASARLIRRRPGSVDWLRAGCLNVMRVRQKASRERVQAWGLRVPAAGVLAIVAFLAAMPLGAESYFVILEGLGGEPSYQERFSGYADELREVCEKTAGDESRVHVLSGEAAKRGAIEDLFAQLAAQTQPRDSIALFLVGHGTWDGHTYKFNIPGPDITATQLQKLLDALPADRQLVAVTTSSSGASIDQLKSERRVVVSATRSGRERNAPVFPEYWVAALSDEAADADKNDAITVLEAFNYAEQKVKGFFEKEKRMSTEHARLEGGFAASFTLARLEAAVEAAEDPVVRAWMAEREEIEHRLNDLKLRKDSFAEEQYFDELEKLLVELARKQEEIDEATEKTSEP